MSLEELNDQMTVLAAIQQRQSEVQKLQAAELDAMREELAVMRAKNDETARALDLERSTRDERMREWDQRIDKLVSGFGAFLREHRIAP